MHSKQRYKICNCSVILRELEAFRNYKGFGVIFPENFRYIWTFYETENFSYSSLHHINVFLNTKILGVLFLRKLA